jgi:hypothetical protein
MTDWALVGLTGALVLITGYYAWQNKRMVEEMRRQSRPYIYLVCDGGRLVLKNSGTRSAHWIRVRVLHDADLQEGEWRQEGETRTLGLARLSTNVVVREGVRSLVPGSERGIGRLARPAPARPARVECVVSYQDGAGTSYEERLAVLADPARRPALREAAMQRQRRRPGVLGRFIPWPGIIVRRVALDKNRPLEGRRLADLATEQDKHVADVMLDLAVEERLETEFELQTRSPEEDVQLVEMVKTGHALPSQSDAGAHLNTNFCTAGESSYVLGQWVRERQLLTLEDAVRRLTFQPACIMGLRDRGLVRQGLAADLMVFDLSSIGVKEDEVSHDGPAGVPRRVQRAEGVHHVIVGGKVVLDHGHHTGALPGRVLRAGRPS